RLADRIAIMKDGEIVQEGTPEDIVLSPATDYVREFTLAVPKAKVVRVARAMQAASGAAPAASVSARATVADAAPLFAEGATTLAVTDEAGRVVGHLHRGDVVRLMLGG
ncbi:MAG: ABC transporter ATP-binding protein, partial [Rhodobacteraceae bacterium]|nr:ABC transporter ATP-binding protein [Paracoccaceae bacterium]